MSQALSSATPAYTPQASWLLLVHQLPAEPSRVRVKIWRRLQAVGAVAIKNSVYVLPRSDEGREDFEWIRSQIISQGGEAVVFTVNADDDLSSAVIRTAWEEARQRDWRDLQQQCEEALTAAGSQSLARRDAVTELRRVVKGLRSRAAHIDRIDPLRVAGRRDALLALGRVERLSDPKLAAETAKSPRRDIRLYQGRTWQTRRRPGVDRMASGWLIRRFIDPAAKFRFGERISQEEDVVPFDMFGVELGHHGDRVTFETLIHEFGLSDAALSKIARIVHELDLRSEELSDVEAITVDQLVQGLRVSFAQDDRLLDHGMAIFEGLFASFSAQLEED